MVISYFVLGVYRKLGRSDIELIGLHFYKFPYVVPHMSYGSGVECARVGIRLFGGSLFPPGVGKHSFRAPHVTETPAHLCT